MLPCGTGKIRIALRTRATYLVWGTVRGTTPIDRAIYLKGDGVRPADE